MQRQLQAGFSGCVCSCSSGLRSPWQAVRQVMWRVGAQCMDKRSWAKLQ